MKLYDKAWSRESKQFLLGKTCAGLDGARCSEPATIVDHIEPHRGDVAKFWNVRNWQPLCAHHHGRKTARYDGSFGNKPKARN